MPFLNLSHVTTYTYKQPVSFGDHRIMVRPRESFDQHLLEATLTIDPEPSDVRWLQDVFGNAVAIATFDRPASRLIFESKARVQHEPGDVQHVDIEEYARCYPFTYSSEEMPDLLRSIERQHLDPQRLVDTWARRFLNQDGPTDTLAILTAMTTAIRREFIYQARAEKGTQTPIETLRRRKGTCRDYAMLMIEAVRALGFAARFVSGYVYSPGGGRDTRLGGGNTHAWVRVYLPGSGWVEFDPTNGIIGSEGLIRVAVARDMYQAVPISGTFDGFPGSFLDMEVTVNITVDAPVAPTISPASASSFESREAIRC
jgi:transglutaminase-like putative cysteine protease